MRWLVVVSILVLAGCASAPPPLPREFQPVVHHPPLTLERPWLMPAAKDEVTLFDTRTLRALDEAEALNANGTGRVQRPGLWTGVGIGAFIGMGIAMHEATEIADEIATNTFNCLFSALFFSDCDD